jgi:hypothetical protein
MKIFKNECVYEIEEEELKSKYDLLSKYILKNGTQEISLSYFLE